MNIESTAVDGVLLITPTPFRDDRGSFVRTMDAAEFAAAGVDTRLFVQANQSRSVRGVLRGIHVRSHEGEAKTVRCARGEIFDVAVDLRPSSRTFRQWVGVRLNDVDFQQLYLPAGVGHGFLAMSEFVDVCYQHTGFYDPAKEVTVRWDDSDLGIEWPTSGDLILSDRDRAAPSLESMLLQLKEWF
jgi:dTDP-4-dehydrorhamnose 3,5-epimerase